MTTYPITHDATWTDDEKRGFHMQAHAVLTSQGQAQLTVHTDTNSWGLGFHGGCTLLARSNDQTVVWTSHLYVVGVDAKSIFWGQAARTDSYTEWVPQAQFAQITSLDFAMGCNPKDQWITDWTKIEVGGGVAAKSVASIIAALGSIFVDLKKL